MCATFGAIRKMEHRHRRDGAVALAVLFAAARVDAMPAERAVDTMTEPRAEVDFATFNDGDKRMKFVMEAYEACQWDPAGSMMDVTNTYRELQGAWNSSYASKMSADNLNQPW